MSESKNTPEHGGYAERYTARRRAESDANVVPLLKMKSYFDPFLVIWNHPIRLTVSLLIPFFLLPELAKGASMFFGLKGPDARMIIVGVIVGLIFLPQILVAALDCHKIVYKFYDDHYSFRESFMISDEVRIHYRNIIAVRKKSSIAQKLFGIGTIQLVTETRVGQLPPKQRTIDIPDIKRPDLAVAHLDKIIGGYHKRRDAEIDAREAASAAANTPPAP
jgi:hypothetical protein